LTFRFTLYYHARRLLSIYVNLSLKGHGMKKIEISEFQQYLQSKSLIREKYIPFYAHWARKFLTFIDSSERGHQDVLVEMYINDLRSQGNISDWQIRQAYDSIQLLIYNFLNGNLSKYHMNVDSSPTPTTNTANIIDDTRKAIRIKHYSYRTEQTYIDWIKRFSTYVKKIKNKTEYKDIMNRIEM